jgi:GntR family transcriptional regulator/MocR family aminotransferase
MLTYHFRNKKEGSLYDQLYAFLKEDILSGRLEADYRLPSRRAFARNLGISIVTVETAYEKLEAEGYIYSLPRKGFYVSRIDRSFVGAGEGAGEDPPVPFSDLDRKEDDRIVYDFASSSTLPELFPFTAWARIMRSVISDQSRELVERAPGGGIRSLREAIAAHLLEFRGMQASPGQIIVGAGTEYLYGLILQLLGRDRLYAVEDPGYSKIARIYRAGGTGVCHLPVDREGISVKALEERGADIVHISPAHHFPTGTVMPVSRRYELLGWACAREGRYIIEDDYDSELRMDGRPVPTLRSMDPADRVIYVNTFSKTLASTIRISYMVLPVKLAERFYRELGFYSCTVSSFQQYTLARFISSGGFGSHINRMRRYYRKVRDALLQEIQASPAFSGCRITEEEAGLHFLLETGTSLSDRELKERALDFGIRITCLSDYFLDPSDAPGGILLVSYSGIRPEEIPGAVGALGQVLSLQ